MYYVYGPLGLTDNDLWTVTLGELLDRIEGWRYTRYLERCDMAMMVQWIIKPHIKGAPPSIQKMVGVWDDGDIVTEREQYERVKASIMKRQRKTKQRSRGVS